MKLSLITLLTGLSCLFFVEGRLQWRPPPVKPAVKPVVCSLPPRKGNCKASITKFYYDSKKAECLEFKYGGCGGNQNKFDSKEACERKCGKEQPWKPTKKPTQKPAACNMPPEPGKCKAYKPRFYFNATANQCLSFIYGGCGGNANNFHTQEKCEHECGKKQNCKPDICNMPPVVGRCKAAIPRLYFNSTVNQCLEFIYGGCGGNGNNFESTQECEEQCGRKPTCKPTPSNPTVQLDACKMYPEVGPCRARILRYYFDETINQCVEFIYGGCGGNGNNFISKQECHRQCDRRKPWKPAPIEPTGKPAACSLPPVTGKCKASIPRYYFNPKASKCQEFIYGGCGGNANNFDSMDQCELRCGYKYNRKKDPCLTSQHKGKICTGSKKLATAVWYYDTNSKQCWPSKYEKCGKNLTMFSSCSNCVAACQAHMEAIQVCEKEKFPK
uniref:Pancreatic trypsin inhibitor n=1 Tax=Rhipicephalus zambeziensis TaxID=60191 RepID=A0A224Y2M0_9ACAR